MWILLIPFLMNILLRVEGGLNIQWRQEMEEKYGIQHEFLCDHEILETERGFYYNISTIKLILKEEYFNAAEYSNDAEFILLLSNYSCYALKELITNSLYYRFEKNTKFDLFLAILSLIYLGCLLFY